MFYFLYQWATPEWPFFGVFKAVTFRATFGALLAFLLCLSLGPHIIAWLRRKKIKEDVSKKDSPFLVERHSEKKDTPTMGGVILIGSTLIAVALFARPDIVFVPLAFFSMLALLLIGLYDDWIKLTDQKKPGLSIRDKLFFQFLIGGGVGLALYWYGDTRHSSTLFIPFIEPASWPVLGVFYVFWAALVMTGSSNAVNLTDGLDGLATICTITVAVAFGVLAYFAGHAVISEHLHIPRIRGAEELAVICASLAGACLGFLWFNAHPAEIFMGDTGSLPLGGLVGLAALAIKQELLLMVVGGIFVIEALSVLIQIFSFRYFGRRVFLIAPLHHHFEKLGWSETKIVSRFFIVSVLLAVFSVTLLRIR